MTNTITITKSFLKTASQVLLPGFCVMSIEVPELDGTVLYKDALGDEKELQVGTFLSERMLKNLEADLALLEDCSGIVVTIAR